MAYGQDRAAESGMRDFMEFVGIPIGVLAICTVGLVCLLQFTVGQKSCHASWDHSAYKVQWSFWGDCQLSTDDGKTWQPERVFVDAKVREAK